MSEIIDLALTQAIERYMEMDENAVYDAITSEWPEQIAALLVEFLFNTGCCHCTGMTDFLQIPREHGGSNYIVPIGGCKWAKE